MLSRRLGTALASFCMLAGLVLAGCGGAAPTPATNSPAPSGSEATAIKAEGKVVGYGELADSAWKILNQGFKQQFGIPVENYRANTGPVLSRISSDEAAGKHLFDVVVLESTYLDGLAQKGYLQKLPAGIMDHVDSKWRDPHGYWAGITLTPLTIVYNTSLVPKDQAPKSLEDLLDPRWKGKIAMSDPTLGEAFTRWFYMVRQQKGEDGAKQFFTALAQQNPTMFQSGVIVSTNVNQGQFPIGVSYLSHVVSVAGPKGHLGYVPLNPMPTSSLALAIAAIPAHPQAARALADVMTSASYLHKVAALGYPVTVPGVKSSILGADKLNFAQLPTLSPDQTQEMITYLKGFFR